MSRRQIGPHKPRRLTPAEDRFWPKVDKSGDCWLWMSYRNKNGYGVLASGRHGHQVDELAHRIAWRATNGPIPEGLKVLHHCDNPPCVRPDHLFLGTQADNVADMAAKGRGRHGRLTDDEVRFIRSSQLPQRSLADLFNFSPSNISRVQTRDTYRRVA